MTVTILVIDDSEDDQRLYQHALKDLGCTLVMASTAEDGFAYISGAKHALSPSKRPDLILLDYNLPDADGLNFMKRLVAHSDTPIPIVMLTGESVAAVAVEAMKHGADDYLVKDTEGRYLRLLPGVVGRVMAAHTQREQTQRLRLETETLLRRNQALMRNSMDGIHVMDMLGNIVEANDAFCRMLGYTQEEMARLNVADWDAQWSADELRERFKNLIGKSAQFETVHRRKDGSLINVEISTSGMEIEGQHFLFASSRDISERKQAEQIVRESETKYRLLFETSSDGIFLQDADGFFIDCNENGASLCGLSRAEIIGRSPADISPERQPDGRLSAEVAGEKFAAALSGASQRFEYQSVRADGVPFDVELTLNRVEFRGAPCLQVVARDITERKRFEKSLRQTAIRTKMLMDSVAEGIYGVDLHGNCTFINSAGLRLLGYQEDTELFGKHIHNLIHHTRADGSHYPATECRLYHSLVSHENIHVDDELFWRKDGSSFPVDYWSCPTRQNDEVDGAVITFLDITERKHIHDALRVAAVTFETHDAILITDTSANIIRVNQAFTDITGYSQEEVLGQNPRIMSSGRQDKAFYIEMWQQLLHTGSWAGEILDKRKNGQIYPKWLTITAVRNERQETTNYVAIFSDITARKHAEEEIRNLAFYDSLTRLPNRRLFMDRFRAALTISTRRNDYGAVLFIDLDRFKTLNDTLGHDYGDLLLIEVAARIKSCVREMDTVARLGGDEFVVLIEGVNEDQDEASRNVGLVAEKIRETLAHPYKLKSHKHHSSPSIGISLYRGNENTVDELLQQADMAMYQAKNAGRNAVRFFDPVMQHNVATRAALENDLHHAIALGQLQLHYQVQVDNEHRPVGAEALLRWFHPQRGLVMPNEFITIAEESTLILDIGHWVLEQACRQLALWAVDERMRDLTLAVNVSAKQFAQPNFVDQIAGLVKSHQIVPSRLKLELTESMVLHDLKNTIDTMHALKKLGVKLSMDDFGTGYSSLSYLRDLPLDQIKIDQSFVQSITRDGNDALLVQTIIDLAGNFRMKVIAEGVETEAQLTFLKHHDCTSYQGFLFSKAVPIKEFEELLGSM